MPLPPNLQFEERFVRASGPGGQNVNKVATAVQLRFDVARSTLSREAKGRLATLAGRRLTDDGFLVIDSREHRTQAQNREAARARLFNLIEASLKSPRKRRPTRPTKSSKESRLRSKQRRAKVKRQRKVGDDD